MRFSDLMGDPDSDPAATDAPVPAPAPTNPATPAPAAAGQPSFAQLNVAQPASETEPQTPDEGDRLATLEAIDDDLLPRAQRRGRR